MFLYQKHSIHHELKHRLKSPIYKLRYFHLCFRPQKLYIISQILLPLAERLSSQLLQHHQHNLADMSTEFLCQRVVQHHLRPLFGLMESWNQLRLEALRLGQFFLVLLGLSHLLGIRLDWLLLDFRCRCCLVRFSLRFL